MQLQQLFAGVLVVLALGSAIVADPLPEPAKGRRNGEVSSLRPQYRAAALDDDVLDESTVAANKTDGSSSGRLFMRKFMLFKNMFGTTQQQPIIPIIIAGGSPTTGTTATSPTTTVITETGTIPSATGIVTITPTTSAGTPPTSARADPDDKRIADADEALDEPEADEPQQADEAGVLDEQSIQAALAANSQEYVVTNEEMRGSVDGKASQQPARVNLRRKGAQNNKNGQMVSIRVPPRYRRYFKKGQTVMLSTNGANKNKRRPGTKRIIRKRPNKNRRRKVKRPQRGANKKRTGTRIVAA